MTWLEISKSAIKNNLQQFRKLIGSKIQLMAVVKSNAYGHGMIEVAKIAVKSGADWLGVVNLDEAVKLRQAKIKAPLFIFSYWDISDIRDKIRMISDCDFPVYTFEQVKILSRIGKKIKKPVNIHLKIDIGTSRIGIFPNQAVDILKEISKISFLNLAGIFAHYASSESYDQTYTNWQTEKFKTVLESARQMGFSAQGGSASGGKKLLAHAACTASTIVNPATHFDLVRVGIGLYGLWPSSETKKLALEQGKQIDLKPALSWKTRVIQVKELPSATFIGYGCTFKTKKKAKIAVLPIGYWEGYDRKLSNPTPLKLPPSPKWLRRPSQGMGQGEVLINGKRCPIRGRICMNLTMVEVPNLPTIRVGDEVVLIGKQGNEEITADELANKIGTINYEVVTRINPLIPRKYV